MKKVLQRWKNSLNGYPYKFSLSVLVILIADALDILDRFCVQAETLVTYWQSKVVIGALMATLISINHTVYPDVMMAIFWLIILDITSKWVAISNDWVKINLPNSTTSYWDKVKLVPLAYQSKMINSSHLFGGFLSKVLQYALLMVAGNYVDSIIRANGIVLPINVLYFTIGFICYNELLSICENLRDSDVKHMDYLIELMTTNVLNKLKK